MKCRGQRLIGEQRRKRRVNVGGIAYRRPAGFPRANVSYWSLPSIEPETIFLVHVPGWIQRPYVSSCRIELHSFYLVLIELFGLGSFDNCDPYMTVKLL